MTERVHGHNSNPVQIDNDAYRAILDTVQCMVIISDSNGFIIYCNKYVSELTGFGYGDIVGKKCRDVIFPAAENRRFIEDTPAPPGATMSFESPIRTRNNAILTAQWRATSLHNSDEHGITTIFVSTSVFLKEDFDGLLAFDLKYIIEAIPDAIILFGLDGRIINVNRAMLDMFEIDRDTALRFSIDKLASIEYSTPKIRTVWNDILGGRRRVFDWKARDQRTGSDIDVKLSLMKMNAFGSDMVFGILRDISYRKIVEREFIESENKFRSLFENAAIPQLIIANDRFVDCNKKALEMIGLSRKDEIIGLSPADISPARQPDGTSSQKKVARHLSRALMHGPQEFEWLHTRRNGDELFSIVMLTPIVVQGKTVLHTIWTDITGRKAAEREIIASEMKYRSIFESVNDAILVFRGNRIIDCNKWAAEMFGFTSKEELLGADPALFWPPKQDDGTSSYELAALRKLASYLNGKDQFEWVFRKNDGKLFPAEVSLSWFELDGRELFHAAIRDITRRKNREAALRESEKRNRLLADMTFEGIMIHDNGIIYDLNAALVELFGYERDELIGKNVIEMLIDPDSKKTAYEHVAAQRTEPYELVFHTKKGARIQAEVMGKPLTYRGTTMRIAALRDITRRKRMEETLRESENRFRAIFESANESIIIHHADSGRIINANKKALDQFGCGSAEELNDDHAWDEPPYSFRKAMKVVHEVRDGGPQNLEWRIRSRNGAAYWLDTQLTPIDIDGTTYVMSMFHDITQRKAAEAALKESEEKFRRVAESSLDVFLATDARMRIRHVSASITRYTGFTPDELTGSTLDILLASEGAQVNLTNIRKALKGETVGLFETPVRRKDGSHAFIEVSIVPVTGADRETELEFYARDISDKIHLEREVIRISDLERRRIGQDLHDGIGQSLTGISLLFGNLARKIQTGRPVEQAEFSTIARSVQETMELARKTARGLFPVTLGRGGLLTAISDMARVAESNSGIPCTVTLRGPQLDIEICKSNQLFYIVSEAVNNAIKHSRAKTIAIDIIHKPGKLAITIENDGQPRHTKTESDGMGLKIMDYRAKLIGAELNMKPKHNGFVVKLEINVPDEPGRTETTPTAP